MAGADERFAVAARAAGLDDQRRALPGGNPDRRGRGPRRGCEVGQIVKSLVFLADGEPVVALVSGADRLDTDRLAATLPAGTGGPSRR